MANLDTRSKRASSVQIMQPYNASLVAPDGTISQGDKQHAAWTYSGILVRPPTPAARTWPIDAEVRVWAIAQDGRVWAIDSESRVWAIAADGRVWAIDGEVRIYEVTD